MSADTSKSKDWLEVRLQPAESVMACIGAILWVATIGAMIAADRMITLVSAAFALEPPALTSFICWIGSSTVRYWLIAFPLWGVIVVGSFLWALSLPEKRQPRLGVLAFALVLVLFAVVVATYLPFAQAAASIARPHNPSSAFPP